MKHSALKDNFISFDYGFGCTLGQWVSRKLSFWNYNLRGTQCVPIWKFKLAFLLFYLYNKYLISPRCASMVIKWPSTVAIWTRHGSIEVDFGNEFHYHFMIMLRYTQFSMILFYIELLFKRKIFSFFMVLLIKIGHYRCTFEIKIIFSFDIWWNYVDGDDNDGHMWRVRLKGQWD